MVTVVEDTLEQQMEGRIARLESDVTHMRTDIADLKLDVREIRVEVTTLNKSVSDLRDEMHTSFVKVDARFAEMGGKFDSRFAEMEGKFDSRFAGVDGRFTAVDSELALLESRIDRKFLEVKLWMGGLLLTMLGVMAHGFKWL